MKMINFSAIERKWQKRWADKKAFVVKEGVKGKKKHYVLEMYPYPSSSGLHMGHAFNYTVGDIYARLKRMQGFNVLYPMGFDSFGLPAENAAIKEKVHPKKFTDEAIKNYIAQMKSLGLSYDWSRKLMSHDPEYYKWNQYFFLKFFEKGLVYRDKAKVNWCPKCNTVLANEQVHNGKCWRHEDTDVIEKNLEQWFIRTTKYADELLKDIENLDWPERIKVMQKNWIGKSEGTEVDFEIPLDRKTNFVLMHGFTGSPKDCMFPWLKKEFEDRGYRVQVPRLPDTDNPNVMDQVKYVLDNEKFDENTILFGHSLGCPVALKVVESLKKPIKKLILAAGFLKPVFEDHERPFAKTFDWKFDFEKIRNNIKEIIILRASNDAAVGRGHADKIQEAIGGEIIDFKAEDNHICGKKEPVVLDNCLQRWNVFTTRPDTLFGVTFMVVSAGHLELMSLVSDEQKNKVENFLKKLKKAGDKDLEKLDKEGVFTGSYALHPLTQEKIPIWVGNFVVAEYGSGMVMAVPAHDQRDFEFAQKYKLPIKMVVCPHYPKKTCPVLKEAYVGFGHLVDSEGFNGLKSVEAMIHITNALSMKKKGKKTVNYRLRDWLVSRQRYWGTPIPIIYCDKCGVVPVKEKDLPVKLPERVKFGKGNPLAGNKEFVNVKCPKCSKKARRETDTMDTFFDSSWYYLRYLDIKNSKKAFDKRKADYWMPVDQYIGGAEHACMHLIYARFFTKALRDLGFIDKRVGEPFTKLFNQGMLHGKDGYVMSKSRGNVILPEEVSKKYGIDTARLFLVSVASPDKDVEWDGKGVEGSLKFVMRVMDFVEKFKSKKITNLQESKLHRTIRDYTVDLESFRYNLAVIKLRELFGVLEEGCDKKSLEIFLRLFGVVCPHVAEEMWGKLGNKKFISLEKWPKLDKKKIDDELEEREKQVEKTVEDIKSVLKILRGKTGAQPTHQPTSGELTKKKVYLYMLPNEVVSYDSEKLSKRIGLEVKVFAVNDKEKYDPEGKSKKVKPGRPGIFVE